MKILLIEPPELFLKGTGITRSVLPLGLAYIASYMEEGGHDVKMLLPDTRSYTGSDPWSEIARAIASESPDIVGITAVTALIPAACHLADLIKNICPETATVIGGPHISSDPVGVLQKSAALDFGVFGEGEDTMAELTERLASPKGDPDFSKIKGLIWREDAIIRVNQSRPVITDLDRLPLPMRGNLVWPDDIHPGFYQSMITVRGCSYSCIYCAAGSVNKCRLRSPENILVEIDHLLNHYHIPYLFFSDSVFTISRRRTETLCRGLKDYRLNLPFAIQTRADRVDGPLLDLLKQAGCHQIFFGIESGDETSLQKIGKQMTLQTIRDAVRLVKDRGIRCTGFFMVGFPWEDEVLIRKTANFSCSLNLDTVSLFSATPLPGTELWKQASNTPLPESIDFTTPQVNLTRLPDEHYRNLFQEIKSEINAYNMSLMGTKTPHFSP